MAFRFNLGDRVYATQNIDHNIRQGLTGTITWQVDACKDTGWVGVQWDERLDNGHHCHGTCPRGYGWKVHDKFLELIESGENSIEDFSESEVEDFLLS